MKDKNNEYIKDIVLNNKAYIAILFVCEIITGVFGVVNALVLKGLVDGATINDKAKINLYTLYLILSVLIMVIARAFHRFYNEKTQAEIENTIKGRIFFNILNKKYDEVSLKHSGEYLNLMTNDAVLVAKETTSIIPNAGGILIKFVSAIVAIIYLMPLASLILIPCLAIIFVYANYCRKRLKDLHKAIQVEDGKLRVYFQEIIKSLLVVKAFNKEVESLDDANTYMSNHEEARIKRIEFSNICNTGLNFMMRTIYVIAIVYAVNGIYKGVIEVGTLVALSTLIMQVRSPIVSASGLIPRYYSLLGSIERVIEIEQLDNDTQNIYSQHEIKEFYDKEFIKLGLSKVDFSYDDKQVLNNFSFELKKGQIVGLVGKSGIGKTTVLKLLMSLYELDGGKKYINNKELTSDYRSLFAYVPHENLLIQGTIEDCVCFGSTKYREEICDVLKLVGLNEYCDSLDLNLGESGKGLSEGQLQRLAIARALYTNRPILLLDEATSALDNKTEKKLLRNIKRLKNKSVIIVTHRKEVLEICDKVVTIR